MTERSVSLGIGEELVSRLARDVADGAEWLSALDGATGDGDHGVNMRVGFQLAARRVAPDATVPDALVLLADTLVDDVGGVMGPLYGAVFLAWSDASRHASEIDAPTFAAMLAAGAVAVTELGGARPGDKTLVDVLVPAAARFGEAPPIWRLVHLRPRG